MAPWSDGKTKKFTWMPFTASSTAGDPGQLPSLQSKQRFQLLFYPRGLRLHPSFPRNTRIVWTYSRKRMWTFFPSTGTDCPIDLKPGVKILVGCIYAMLELNFSIFRVYLNERYSLAMVGPLGMPPQPASVGPSSPSDFAAKSCTWWESMCISREPAEKPAGGRLPYLIPYWFLNQVTICYQSPLPFIPQLLS